MVIETKYNTGQKIFIILDNEIQSYIVDSVSVHLFNTKTNTPDIHYTLKNESGGYRPGEYPEYRLFTSKEELIKSL